MTVIDYLEVMRSKIAIDEEGVLPHWPVKKVPYRNSHFLRMNRID